jgi:hypothetical protein
MAPKTVKVVEINSEMPEETPVSDPIESETVVETPLVEDVKETVEEVPKVETEEVEQPTKKNHKFNRKSGPQILSKDRVDELVSCQKCGKMVLERTLNYSHLKSCAKHTEDFVPVRELKRIKKIKANIPDEVPKTTLVPTQPKPIPIPIPIPVVQQIVKPQLSYQEMRRDYHRNRVVERSDNMKKLFQNAI